jgi:hypothetical protein
MSRVALEDFSPVPVEMFRLRPPIRVLGLPDRLILEGHQSFLEARRAVRLVGHQQDTLAYRERPQVERLMVQHAEGQTVVFGLRAAGLVPANVRGIQGDRVRAESDIEAADGAAELICLEHPLAEGRIAFAAGDDRFQRQSDRVQNVGMERLGKVSLEYPAGDGRDQPRIGGKGGPNVGRKFGPDVVRPQLGDARNVRPFLGL